MAQLKHVDDGSRNALLTIGKRLRPLVPGMRRSLVLQVALSVCSGLLIVGQSYFLTQIIAQVFVERQAPACTRERGDEEERRCGAAPGV